MLVLSCVVLGRVLILDEFRGTISSIYGIGHTQFWKAHLSQSNHEAATVRIGLFSENSHENQD